MKVTAAVLLLVAISIQETKQKVFALAYDITVTPKTAAAPIVISGCGPAALVFAHRFLRLNPDWNLCIYEKRKRPVRYVDTPSSEYLAGGNAFGFGINKRSQGVLNTIPGLLQAIEDISQVASFAPGIDVRLINRRELCAELLFELEKELERNHSSRLSINFETEIIDLNDTGDSMTVTILKPDNTTEVIEYSLLVAADGANSVVRNKLVERGNLQCERYFSDITWKALQLPEQPNLDASSFFRYPQPSFKSHRSITRDRGAIIPRFQNRHVLLNFRSEQMDGSTKFVLDATRPAELRCAIQALMPNITNFPNDEVLQAFIEQKPGRESFMKLDRHYVPERNVVFVGDAAVGMYSLFGQGATNAMVCGNLLAESLQHMRIGSQEDFATKQALQQFSDQSVIEGHAISDLNLLTHSLRKPGVIKFWAALQMMGIGKTLAQKPEVPYSKIRNKWKLTIWISKYFWRKERIDRK